VTAAVAAPRAGKGRQPSAIEDLRDRRDELDAHLQEALAFCDAAWPLLSRLELATQHIGPTAHQTALHLGALLARYERHHLPTDPAAEVAA
jgi:hypothetical protein